MEVSVNVLYLMLIVFSALLMVLLVYFILFARNANKAILNLKNIIEKNKENINMSLASLPDVLKNVNDVAMSAKASMGEFGLVAGSLDGALANTALAVNEGANSFLALIALASNMVKTVVRLFTSGKK